MPDPDIYVISWELFLVFGLCIASIVAVRTSQFIYNVLDRFYAQYETPVPSLKKMNSVQRAPKNWPSNVHFRNAIQWVAGSQSNWFELPIHEMYHLELFFVPLSHPAFPGFGVRTTHAIPKDTIIGHYAGQLRPISFGQAGQNQQYVMSLDHVEAEVDALYVGNLMRFINDPMGTNRTHNVISYWEELAPNIMTAQFCASRDIAAGEELLLVYEGQKGIEYWERDEESTSVPWALSLNFVPGERIHKCGIFEFQANQRYEWTWAIGSAADCAFRLGIARGTNAVDSYIVLFCDSGHILLGPNPPQLCNERLPPYSQLRYSHVTLCVDVWQGIFSIVVDDHRVVMAADCLGWRPYIGSKQNCQVAQAIKLLN